MPKMPGVYQPYRYEVRLTTLQMLDTKHVPLSLLSGLRMDQ